MKVDTSKFVCDCGCGESTNDVVTFPYESGWFYVHEINFKIKHFQIIKQVELHFYSIMCFTTWFKKVVAEKMQEPTVLEKIPEKK